MDNALPAKQIQPTKSPDAIESEEFKLEMLDCGPGYTYSNSELMCFSCFCGSGCLCGCVSQTT
jgi:hypothetical protein